MKKTLLKLIASVCLLTAACWAIAGRNPHWFHNPGAISLPDAKEELNKLYTAYIKKDAALDIKGSIRLYDEEHDNTLKEENSFRIIKQDSQIYTRLSYIQTFVRGELAVELDTVNRTILVSKLDPAASTAIANHALMLGQWFSDTARFKMTGSVTASSNTRTLRLQTEMNPEIRSCSITYDTVSYRVRQAEIEWWKQGQIADTSAVHRTWLARIDYVYLPFSGLDSSQRIDHVIRISGQIIPALEYKDYKIHNRF